ncbi:hypothetical protein AJ79_02111 [Helicocarpus griseus UAMH5409]|uniref:polynucleotide adenylyltransferase n=1 Tax=Helicocarpus griseus UAMH5409 TaxID=1447875 RepID=A0A2B7XVZ5_9EURO|nr:hypothetical protein AJ79_02111 [Helicocarpus griseus UAMH5409]
MADSNEPTQGHKLTLNGHQTAVCIIPPVHLVDYANQLRAIYDTAYEKWPAHVNLVYPFVSANRLPAAVDLIQSNLTRWAAETGDHGIHLHLNQPGNFPQRQEHVVYLGTRNDNEETEKLRGLQSALLDGFKRPANEQNKIFHPHMTIGQSKATGETKLDFLLAKARLLPPVQWQVHHLAVMVREKASNKMKVWGTINLDEDASFTQIPTIPRPLEQIEEDEKTPSTSSTKSSLSSQGQLYSVPFDEPKTTYHFSQDAGIWTPIEPFEAPEDEEQMPSHFRVASYNVLVLQHPPTTDRFPALLNTLISKSSQADVLLLQEVCDEFLTYILGSESIQNIYPFCTHGPPGENGIGPLPSLRNIVALSRSNFTWSWLPFGTQHKGAVVLCMNELGKMDEPGFAPAVVASVHLSSGLFDHTIAARKQQLQKLFDLFSARYPSNPKVITGDFNMTTSSFTNEEAVQKKMISPQAAATLPVLESMIPSAGYSDAWVVARAEMSDRVSPSRLERDSTELYDGEQGATFDPLENPLAVYEDGKTESLRPHRYDRIIFDKRHLRVTKFNMFGFPIKTIDESTNQIQLQYPSDHWGIRASLEFTLDDEVDSETEAQETIIEVKKAGTGFQDPTKLKSYLADRFIVPSSEEAEKRKTAFSRLKHIIQHGSLLGSGEKQGAARSKVSIIVTPVGSYGLGVWTESSDIDCLCVGSISSRTFFALVIQRLKKGTDAGVKVLRKVKATTGTMLELEIDGIRFDLQYCPAAAVAERWLEASRLPRSHPLFDLALLPLMKLQPYRDQTYLQQTIQSPATFRLLHRIIKTWAKHRGIYSSKFGYLGGVHITMMLSRLLKHLPPNSGSVADILCTFFNYYGNFNWKEDMVYDSTFYKKPPRYHRTPREGMVILTLHTPVTNVARSASVSSTKTVVDEMKRAYNLISDCSADWTRLVGAQTEESASSDEFLKAYTSYIKINVQYWGLSLAKGSSLVGWLESKSLLLLADLHRKLPEVQTRIWPSRFTQNENSDDNFVTQEEREYQGCYLIGLTKAEQSRDSARFIDKAERKQAQDKLQAAIDLFTNHIHGDQKNYDPTSAWVDASHIKQADIGSLHLDKRNWGDYISQDDNLDDSDSEEGGSDVEVNEDDDAEADLLSASKKALRRLGTGTNNKSISAAKLRPASDILSRLRWDPSLGSSEYVVGYEDRFVGAKEIPLDRWKSEQTDEEFIPQHRILYFKRKGDGRVVWDRETRRDEVFGSGVGKGEE